MLLFVAQVELSSESNLFFLYVHDMTEATFKQMQAGRLRLSAPAAA